MREWNLKARDPLSLTLAADARLGPTDYCNDQTWELNLTSGEPPALSLQTTFGLRARLLRIFPRFREESQSLTDPSAFHGIPKIFKIYPNYANITFSPFLGIDACLEYWVSNSHTLVGKMKLTNQSGRRRNIQCEWVVLLNPSGEDSQRIAITEMGAGLVLTGKTGDLSPVFFLTNGPRSGSGPFPSLALDLELAPTAAQQLTWSLASLSDKEASFETARQAVSSNFNTEIARLEMQNASQVEILTGNQDWDIVLSLSQKVALGLFHSPTDNLPYPSFVATRQPDQGYSLRGNGSDYTFLWNGQTALGSYYLANIVLPAAPDLAVGLLRNFLFVQNKDGFIDGKPGLAGQRSQLLATPILANLTWRIYQVSEDIGFLKDAFPPLLAYFRCWFREEHDRDQDGIPEWNHPIQTGFDEQPLFSYWQSWSPGIDITTTESPTLCAFLYQEAQFLIRIAELIGQKELIPELQDYSENLRTTVEVSWDPKQAIYRYWDRDSHYTDHGESLGERVGAGTIPINRTFEHPVRVLIRIQASNEITRRPQIYIHGTSPNGQHLVEKVLSDRFQWYIGLGSATSDRVYQSLERLEFLGLDSDDRITIQTVGLNRIDQTLLLPLWAGIPAPRRAKELVKKTVTNPKRFWKPFGLPACPEPFPGTEAATCQKVDLLWNALIAEGLLRYGYRHEAAELVTRWMKAIIPILKNEAAFRKGFDAETGQPGGERNALEGLIPVGLFLEILGVRLISSHELFISGFNPFPWPVTVKYRGITVLRTREKTTVIFPGGQTVSVNKPDPCRITLE